MHLKIIVVFSVFSFALTFTDLIWNFFFNFIIVYFYFFTVLAIFSYIDFIFFSLLPSFFFFQNELR